jgi:hypothetical protein
MKQVITWIKRREKERVYRMRHERWQKMTWNYKPIGQKVREKNKNLMGIGF